jgi:hypothetical protein
VVSFLAPRICGDAISGSTSWSSWPPCAQRRRATGQSCPSCGRPMELDDVEHKYQLLVTLLPRPPS